MFWDSSAIIPYLVPEAWSEEAAALLSQDRTAVIWWTAPVECSSALERRRREGTLGQDQYEEARRRHLSLLQQVDIIEAHSIIRDRAIRLLGLHPLRSADALHLAAALIYFDERPQGESFVCLDDRLRLAARTEGFTLVPAS